MAKKRGYKTPKTLIRELKRRLDESRKQQVPWYPPMEMDPSKRAILGMHARKKSRKA